MTTTKIRILKFVLQDNKDVVEHSEGERNICSDIRSSTEEVTATPINMLSQTDIVISSREFEDFKAPVQQKIAKSRRDFSYKVNQTSFSKVSVVDSSVMLFG